jgi:SAM-dependent methyltransferase
MLGLWSALILDVAPVERRRQNAGMDIEGLNRAAWDKAVEGGDNPYTQVVSSQQVADARAGSWAIHLSEHRTVPREWFPSLGGLRVLCLAGGGGQQAPILSAAGAEVTLLDGSPRQLSQDAFVAERDGLALRLVQGDMADLSAFGDASFDLVVNPISTLFVPDVGKVWRECRRVLVSDGVLIAGFMNPDEFVFDPDALDERGEFVVKYPLPYVEHDTLDAAALQARIAAGKMFHFSHTMEAQLGGIIDAGFVITGFYEDRRTEEDGNPIRFYMPSQFIVRAVATDAWSTSTARGPLHKDVP